MAGLGLLYRWIKCRECGKRVELEPTQYELCDDHVSDEIIDKHYPS